MKHNERRNMKKLLTLIGASLAIGFAHAAAVSWNSGTFANGFKGPDGNTLASSTAYTMIVTFYSDAAGNTVVGSESTVASAKPNGAYTAKTGDVFAAETTYYVKALIKANDGSATWETAIASFTTAATGDVTINFTTGSGFDTVSQKWASGGWETGGSVPEPTSGLLVALGLAGLALRRKRV